MAALTAAGWTRPQSGVCGFTEDPDGSPEPIIYMGTSCSTATPTQSPSPTPTLTPSATPATTLQPLAPADINCDHAVTGADSLILIRFAANVETTLSPDCPPIGALSMPVAAAVPAQLRGDLDCSGGVDVKDALVILRLLGGVASLWRRPARARRHRSPC